MSEELLVNVTPRETRVAVVENGMLQELHIERGSQRGVVGNIYKGKVQRVMPGMQAAFVDIGLDRAAFLHANDIFRSSQLDAGEVDDPPATPSMQVQIPITELLRDGAEIVVQVVKDPIGSKGARLAPFTTRGLAEFDGAVLRVMPGGRPYARTMAALFDPYRQDSVRRFSSAV